MVVYHAKAVLIFSSTARRDAVLADIESFIASRTRFGDSLVAPRTIDGQPAIVCSLSFVVRADASALQSRIETFATGVRAPRPGSYLILHDCTSFDGGDGCTNVVKREW